MKTNVSNPQKARSLIQVLAVCGLVCAFVLVLVWRTRAQTASTNETGESGSVDAIPAESGESPEPTFVRAYDRLKETVSEDELRALAIEYPDELEQELAKLKTPKEQKAEALADLAILHPAEYSARFPKSQPSLEALLAEMDEEAFDQYAATNQATDLAGLKERIGRPTTAEVVQRRAEAMAAMADLERQHLPPPMIPSEPAPR